MPSGRSRAFEIGPATESDADAVLRVWKESGTHSTLTDDREGVVHLIADAPGALLVAADGSEVVDGDRRLDEHLV
jgi:hypothetical protein